MIRNFLTDRRGNFSMMMMTAVIPIMGGLALAVDYTEISRQKQATINALDAAGIATARRLVEGATDTQAKAYALDFFRANLGTVVLPANATLTIILPSNNTAGGGTLKLSAALKYQPYFLPVAAMLVGKTAAANVDFAASSEIKLKNTLEVALVLDNSGSMDYIGSGSGKKRIDLLKTAAKQLVDTLAAQAAQLKQLAKPVQFGLVPFAASVNVGSANSTATWMDQDGISPISHENFDWTTFKSANTGDNRTVQKTGGIYYKKGTAWGAQENKKVTRFTLLNDIQRVIKTGTSNGHNVYGNAPYASWGGCVESRPSPYNITDAVPSTGAPATLFVPMMAPDETDRTSSGDSAESNWWADLTTSSTDSYRQSYMPKYFTPAPYGTNAATGDQGPNASCTTTPITPMTDVSTTEGKDAVKAAIDDMEPLGATNVPEGMAWGWRVISSTAPFTDGRPETENGNDKVVIVLTDGANTYYTPSSLGYNDLAGNKSIYSSFGYAGKAYDGGTTSRLFKDTSNDIGKTDYDNDNYSAALNEHFAKLCDNAKAAKVMVMTVSLDLDPNKPVEKAQMDALKKCSSDSRFRKDPNDASKADKNYWNTTGGDLAETFKKIADELSNLRIVG